MKTLQEIGEFGLIAKIKDRMAASLREVIQGIGDDVAVLDMGKKALLLTTDILIEDIHFERAWTNPYYLGRKALAVNLSDIAAMGGTPKYFLISIGLPKELSYSFVSLLYRGLKAEARRFQVDLIGGDTSLSKKIIMNICLIGEGKRKDLLFRKGAKAGEDLYVSGTLGDAALGLRILKERGSGKKPKGLIDRHLAPNPRVELGQALARRHLASAMIDVSDGLLSDTLHLMEESKVGARIWRDRLPLSKHYRRWVQVYSRDTYQMALSGGEDYELLFTSSPKMRRKILSLCHSFHLPITRVGEILRQEEGFQLVGEDGERIHCQQTGFDHFR